MGWGEIDQISKLVKYGSGRSPFHYGETFFALFLKWEAQTHTNIADKSERKKTRD